jgi:hypothetical protein
MVDYIVAYLLKTRTLKPEGTALLGNGCVNKPIAVQQICNTQQWSNWGAVLFRRSMR